MTKLNYDEIATRYNALKADGHADEAVAYVLLVFNNEVLRTARTFNKYDQMRAYELVNRRGNNFVKRYELDIPKNFVRDFLRDRGKNFKEDKDV